MRGWWLSVLASSAIVFAPLSASASVTFIDGVFNAADYTETLYSSGGTLTYAFCANCGQNGVPGLQATLNSTTNNGVGAIAFINTTFVYNPSVLPVTSISASVDKILTDSIPNTGATNSFHPTIEQDGIFYIATIAGPPIDGTTTGWHTLSGSGLQSSDFQEYDFSTGTIVAASPNFSGDAMTFGLTQIFTNPGEFSAVAIYDPLVITLSTAVPEPSTWALLIIGFAGMGLAARRTMLKKARVAA
jgi:PEP-CTERM motif